MSQKTTAQLLLDNNNVVTTQTAPESITPTTLGALLLDIIESNFNRADDAPLIIPSGFSGILVPSSSANQLFQALLDRSDYLQTLITGGVQGRPGEFVACVADCALQIYDPPPTNSYTDAGIVIFPDDKDNGSFDNGNNWLFSKYIAPATGFSGIFSVYGFALKLIQGAIAPSDAQQYAIEIIYNRGLGSEAILATSSIMAFDDTSNIGDLSSASTLVAGTPGSPIVLVGNDTIEIMMRSKNLSGSSNTGYVQVISGLVAAQKV